ncbi:endonuclease NucS domain-containing protein [Terriglobus sp. ADX1]|uniref:endonuclease NucS domain-containing protein n=1 Tax=Terriglobus sp. ADX1 TaxID=2794063 RepID=UPI002FE53CA6
MAGKIKQIQVAIAACFEENTQPLTRAQIVAWIGGHYPDSGFNPSTITAQIYRSCINVPSAQEYSAPKILFFDKQNRTYRLASGTDTVVTVVDEESPVESSEEEAYSPSSRFALESHLRDYLVANLQVIEPGLVLWNSNPPTVEYQIGKRRIDILAKDKAGTPVVIELKRGLGYDKVVGQALLYQGMIAREMNIQRVRIILIASEVSDELKIASSRLSDIDLLEYSISMQTTRVNTTLLEE